MVSPASMCFCAFLWRGFGQRVYDVRAFGARGDGTTPDTAAINKAIEAAAAAGGGTVNFPAGTYISVSIRLRSNITLQVNQGATILAADRVPAKSNTIFLSRNRCQKRLAAGKDYGPATRKAWLGLGGPHRCSSQCH
jgi:polygalacturonase